MGLREELDCESAAEWRRQKAIQFPNDTRNLEAAEQLDRLAAALSEIDLSEYEKRYQKLLDLALDGDANYRLWEDLNEYKSGMIRDVGFHGSYTAIELVEEYLEYFEELVKNQINEASDSDQTGLADRVKEDPAVISARAELDAAQERYNAIYAKAYAEARKRL